MTAPESDLILERMMALHPKIIDLTLGRVRRLLGTLGHPERNLPPVIHIAGTNGKGSTLAMIRAGLEGAGEICHAYTSPHLSQFRERIRLAGDLISESALTSVLNECYSANAGRPITYFEITTAAALTAFARAPADWTLLEVGLGGRLDATNVVDAPVLTVLTPVSIDHQKFLGETLAEIAGEKAGILKHGIPCIVGPQEVEALEVIEERAADLDAPLLVHGRHWQVFEKRGRLSFQDETGFLDLPLPVLTGTHQAQNAGIAIAALRKLGKSERAIGAALTQTVWPARLQRLRVGPLVVAAGSAELWLDGGHNPAAGAALAEALTRLSDRPLHLICGMLSTKDVAGYLHPLARVARSLTAVPIPGETAAFPPESIAASARQAGLEATTAPSVADALERLVARESSVRILICGSLYLAGHILGENG